MKHQQVGISQVVASPVGVLALPPEIDLCGVHSVRLPGVIPGHSYVWAIVDGVLELWSQDEWEANESTLGRESARLNISDSL